MLVHKFKAIQLSVCRNLVYEISEKKKKSQKNPKLKPKVVCKKNHVGIYRTTLEMRSNRSRIYVWSD